MLDRPYLTLRRLARKNNSKTKELVKYVFELSDKFSLWIIGISLASISLLVSHLKDVGAYISSSNLNTVLISLFISVFFGILYRVVFVFYYIYLEAAYRVINYNLANDEHMDTESLLNGNETIDDLIRLNTQFINTQGLADIFNQSDDAGKQRVYNDLVATYVRNVAWAKRDFDFTLSTIADTYHKHLGINRNKFFKEPSNFRLNFTKYASIISYLGLMLSFLFAYAFFLIKISLR